MTQERLPLDDEDMETCPDYPKLEFTMQSMIAKEEKHFFWLDQEKIKKKFMERMCDTRTV